MSDCAPARYAISKCWLGRQAEAVSAFNRLFQIFSVRTDLEDAEGCFLFVLLGLTPEDLSWTQSES